MESILSVQYSHFIVSVVRGGAGAAMGAGGAGGGGGGGGGAGAGGGAERSGIVAHLYSLRIDHTSMCSSFENNHIIYLSFKTSELFLT